MKIGRNSPCPCGSGKKYKKCHYLIKDTQEKKRVEDQAELNLARLELALAKAGLKDKDE